MFYEIRLNNDKAMVISCHWPSTFFDRIYLKYMYMYITSVSQNLCNGIVSDYFSMTMYRNSLVSIEVDQQTSHNS